MKTSRIFSTIFIVCCFISCQREEDNMVLTDFTKELISMYINDSDNVEAKNRKDEMIIVSSTDTLHYYLSIFSNNNKSYKYCRNDFVGQTLYLGHRIRVFGNEDSIFYFIREKIKTQKPCRDNSTVFYDPLVWEVCLYKDQSFCPMKTYKVSVYEDISAIQSLVEKYFKVSNTGNEIDKNVVYQSHEVEYSPKFLLGEDSLRHIISSNFKIHKKGNYGKVPIIVDVVVDKNGNATLGGIDKSSNDIELDNEALRVAKIICQYEFIPASHRGQKVNAVYSVFFLDKDIVPG